MSNLPEQTVSELSNAIKRTIEDGFSYVRVRGELGRVTKAASGHMYMDLKDDRAVISGVIWKGKAAQLKISPEQGMEVIATGRLTTFPGQSRYQIVIDTLEPAGAGALMALFEERKMKLAGEGLFAEERKRALPFLPQTIGVVTSPTGAVIRDILHRVRDRFPSHVLVWPTLVQGDKAAGQIVKAINGFNAIAAGGPIPRPDVLIVARGGGSLEDLWCFNDEAVARAAAASEIPLISAVGHETDTTLIDFVSDRRAPTPSAAAEMAVPVRTELVLEISNKSRRLLDAATRTLEQRRVGLQSAARGLGRPETLLETPTQRLDNIANRLGASLQARLERAMTRLAGTSGRLQPATLAQGVGHRGQEVARLGQRLKLAQRQLLTQATDRLHRTKLPSSLLDRTTKEGRRALHAVSLSLGKAGQERLTRATERLDRVGGLLDTLSYKSVLNRGYALVQSPSGVVIRSAKTAAEDSAATLVFADGARAIMFGAKAEGGQPASSKSAAKKPKPSRRSGQSSLFD